MARGTVPADVLFIGEAPGASEDVIGKPFIGPAGILLDRIIQETGLDIDVTLAFTNLIACIPKGEDGNKIAEPTEEHIHNCETRLREFIIIAKPKAIVFVGKLADKYGDQYLDCYGVKIETCSIIHPAAILRMDVSKQGLAIQRAVVAIEDMLEDL